MGADLEQVLIEHPAVADVACIGMPHPEMGEEMRALVELDGGAVAVDEAHLTAFCRE
ncbi:MAG TPA: hypothetical protein VMW08_05080 [Acidimicrobiales bacterium]|nr:hypothetical protein [Acidimicrobiales bacterium]